MARNYEQKATVTAQSYYNSSDADTFYFTIWGGEDIHIGLYENPHEDIGTASRRTVAQMAEYADLSADSVVLDIGSGYGGAARYLASRSGCKVVALNLSEVENERARKQNRKARLEDKIEVVDGSFEDIPFENNSFDLIWSQDAMLHSGRREQVLNEAARVLKPGGRMVFTDPMRSDSCDAEELGPILARLNLSDLACPSFYRETLGRLGFEELGFDENTPQLATHYQRVHDETVVRDAELSKVVGRDYIERMKTGLRHWVEGGQKGRLAWGIFRFRKAS